MIKNTLAFFILFTVFFNLPAQDILGQWKTIDDNTGDAKSIVEIFEEDGKIYGKIIAVFNPDVEHRKCIDCSGEQKDQRIVGLVFIEGLTKNHNVYDGGTILNPENGSTYRCRLKLENDTDTLQVRGYLAFFYRTQYWKRVK
ncbi:hypothetical protein ADIWIN_1576 [Winogradskyella psychrotolerans RS-3]|uniref:DUF2147 domain-containing protein n=1 Tax=Winogradskyella psychrotolerans RS-3 TaxID=641526 RepID=S7VTZ7_9FLAO|nr:DUF2147 domain-containing protein [Winogradskyella psychrotolerans]EPR73546.1 hypothetical protein ADIWIN_1576 [Winogradskyella psychrotolerans RS-3]